MGMASLAWPHPKRRLSAEFFSLLFLHFIYPHVPGL